MHASDYTYVSLLRRKMILVWTVCCFAVLAAWFVLANQAGFAYTAGDSANSSTISSLLESAKDAINGYDLNIARSLDLRFEQMDKILNDLKSGDHFSVSDAIITVASFLVLIHLLLNIIQEAQKGDISAELWFKILLPIVLSLFLIKNCGLLFDAVETFGDGVYNYVVSSIKPTEISSSDQAKLDGDEEIECDYNTLIYLFDDKDVVDQLLYRCKAYEDFDKQWSNTSYAKDPNNENSAEAEEKRKEIVNGLLKYEDVNWDEVRNQTYKWDYLIRGCTFSEADFNIPDSSSGSTAGTTATTGTAGGSTGRTNTAGSTSLQDSFSWQTVQSRISNITTMALVQTVMSFTVDSLIYLLAIQIFMRKLLAPLAMADISIEGTRSTGMRYIKHFFALYIQKMIIYVIGSFGMIVMTSAMSGELLKRYGADTKTGLGIPGIIAFIMVSGCITGMMTQAGTLANEIVGD